MRMTNAWFQGLPQGRVEGNIAGNPFTRAQETMQYWLNLLNEVRDPQKRAGLAFFGPPGIGKSSLLKQNFPEAAPENLWVSPLTLHKIDETLKGELGAFHEYLAKSGVTNLVLDDCNTLGDRFGELLNGLLHHEKLRNRHDKEIRVIFVSNAANCAEFVATGKKDWAPRLTSRLKSLCMEICPKGDDLRKSVRVVPGLLTSADTEYVTGQVAVNVKEVLELHRNLRSLSNEIDKFTIWTKHADGSSRGRQIPVPATLDSQYKVANDGLKTSIFGCKTAIEKAPKIVLDLAPVYHDYGTIEDILLFSLDLIAESPQKSLVLLSPNPDKELVELTKYIQSLYPTESIAKYLSRLKLVGVASS